MPRLVVAGHFRETISGHLAGSRNVAFDPPLDGRRLFPWNNPLRRALMHACLKGFSMLLAHIVAYLCGRKLSLFFLQKTVHNAWDHGHASRDILMPLACIVAHFFLSEDTTFLMEVSRKLCSFTLRGFRRFMSPHWRTFFNNPIRRSFHRVLHEFTGLGNTVSKSRWVVHRQDHEAFAGKNRNKFYLTTYYVPCTLYKPCNMISWRQEQAYSSCFP